MGPLKSPGEDGFSAMFYHRQWDKVGPKICEFAKDVWQDNRLIKEVNKTLLVLIAK